MRLIIALWAIAVMGDGIAAAIICIVTWQSRTASGRWWRFTLFFFFTVVLSKVIRLAAIVSNHSDIPADYSLKSLISMSIEALGIWVYCAYVSGWLNGWGKKK